MNAGVVLVPAVHDVAAAAVFAVAARAAEKSDTNALTDRPALDTIAKRIDPAHGLVSGDAREGDTRGTFRRLSRNPNGRRHRPQHESGPSPAGAP